MKKTVFITFLFAALAPVAQGGHSTKHYGKMTVAASPSGAGTVYLSDKASGATSGSTSYTWDCNKSADADTATRYCYANPNPGYKFTGWSGSGYATSTDNPYELTLKATATSSDSPTTANLTATFEQLPPATVTFAVPVNGSYTVNGETVSAQLVKSNQPVPYSVTLVATPAENFRFAGWYVLENGSKSFFSTAASTTKQFEEDVTVGAEFIPDGLPVYAAVAAKGYDNLYDALTEAQAGESISVYSSTTLDTTAAVGVGVSLTVASGATVTVASGATLYIDGSVTVNGTISGTVSKCTKLIRQTGNNGAPFNPYGDVKYWKTSVSNPGISYSTSQTHASIVNGLGQAFRTTLSSSAKLIKCSIDSSVAVNHIKSFAGESTSVNITNATLNSGMVVLLGSDCVINGGLTKKEGFRGVVDCAGNTCSTVKNIEVSGNNGLCTLLNCPSFTASKVINVTHTYINCSSVTLSSLNAGNTATLKFYDCGTASYPASFSVSYSSGPSSTTTHNFYSGYYNSLSYNDAYKVYGGSYKKDPAKYNADVDNLEVAYDSVGKWYNVVPSAPAEKVCAIGATEYPSLPEAMEAAVNGDTITLIAAVDMAQGTVTVPSGKNITISLEKHSISNGKIVNNGTLMIVDSTVGNEGNVASDIENNGTLDLVFGTYSGAVVNKAGTLTVHNGAFTGSFSKTGGMAILKGGHFKTDVSDFVTDESYLVYSKGGFYWVCEVPDGTLRDTTVSGKAGYVAKPYNENDYDLLYQRVKNLKTTKGDYTLANWTRLAELLTFYEVFGGDNLDATIQFDREVPANTLNINVGADMTLPLTIGQKLDPGELYRGLSAALVGRGYYGKTYKALWEDNISSVSLAVSTSSSGGANVGTVSRLMIELWTSVRAPDYHDPDNKHMLSNTLYVAGQKLFTIGAGSNVAMIRPTTGAATFYSTLASAMSAAADGGTVMLANDCSTVLSLTKAGTYTFDTMGFAYTGGEPTLGESLFVKSSTAVDSAAKVLVSNAVATAYVVAQKIAQVGETFYDNLAEAVAAANGGVITLLAAPPDGNVTLNRGETLKINFGSVPTSAVTVTASEGHIVTSGPTDGVTTFTCVAVMPIEAVEVADVIYNGVAQTPAVTVTDANGRTLVAGTDYTVAYSNNVNVGTAHVTVTGTGTYAGSSKEQTFTISPANITVSVTGTAVSREYNGEEQSVTAAYTLVSESGLYDAAKVAADVPTVKGTAAGSYPYGLAASQFSYNDGNVTATFTVTDAALTITRKAVVVTANNLTKTYGASDPELTAAVEGVIDGASLAYTVTRASGDNAGSYAITVTGAAEQGNYAVTFVGGTFAIGKATLTATADDLSVNRGETPTYSVSYSGWVNGDDVSALTEAPTAACAGYDPTDFASSVTSYEITLSGGSADNYAFELVKGTLTVAKSVAKVERQGAATTYHATLQSAAEAALAANGSVATILSAPAAGETVTLTAEGQSLTLNKNGFTFDDAQVLTSAARCMVVTDETAAGTVYSVTRYVVEDADGNAYVSIADAVAGMTGNEIAVTVKAAVSQEAELPAGKTLAVTVPSGLAVEVAVTPAAGAFLEIETNGATTTYVSKLITVEMVEPQNAEVLRVENGETNVVSGTSGGNAVVAALTANGDVPRTDNTDKLDILDMITVQLIRVVQETVDNKTIVRAATFDVTLNLKAGQTLGEGQTLKFRLPVDANATQLAAIVYHNDAPFGVYPVQSANGERFIEVESGNFSPYGYTLLDGETDNPVAVIGTTGYASLAAAVSAATAGDTVTLLKDITNYTGTLYVDMSLTIDGAGHSITAAAVPAGGHRDMVNAFTGGTSMLKVRAGSVTVRNLTLDGHETHAYTYLIDAINSGTEVTVENLRLVHGGERDNTDTAGSGYGAGIHLNDAALTVKDGFYACTGGATDGVFPFTGILPEGEYASVLFDLTNDTDAQPTVDIGNDLLLVGVIGALDPAVAQDVLDYMNVPSRFIPYTLTLDDGSDYAFTGASPRTWNEIIDYGKAIMDVSTSLGYEGLDKDSTPVEVGLLSDTALPDTFTFADTNLTVNGNGHSLSGAIRYTDGSGTICDTVLGTESEPLVLDITGTTKPMSFGSGVAVSNIVLKISADLATPGMPIAVLDVEDGAFLDGANVTVVLVDAQGNPLDDSVDLYWDESGVAYIGPCEARLTGPTHAQPVYTTFANAVARAAASGDTIKLLSDVTASLTISKSLTLTGDHTISGTTKVNAGATVVASNVTFDALGAIYALDVTGGAALDLQNVTVGGGFWCNIQVNGGTLTGTGVTMRGDEVVVAADGQSYSYRGVDIDAADAPFGMDVAKVPGESVSIPFMDIVRANGTETVALADADGSPLAQAGSLLFLANMPGDDNLAGVTLPARFVCYTLTIDANIDFLGDGTTPTTGWTVGDWNEIIDTGAIVLEALDEDSDEVPVLLMMNGDVDLGDEPFVFNYGNLTVDGNGNALSGTVVYENGAGVISNVVMGTADAPLVLDITGTTDPMSFGSDVTMSNVTILISASAATPGTPVMALDVGNGAMESGANVTVVLVDAQGNPLDDSVDLYWDDSGVAYIGPCEARLAGPTHAIPVFTTLSNAVAQAAVSGDTVTLLSDVMASLTISKSLTLTGNYTILGTAEFNAGATVVISNVTFDALGATYALDIAGGAAVDLQNVTVGGGVWCNIQVNGGTLTGSGVTMCGDDVVVAADGQSYTYRGFEFDAAESPFGLDVTKVPGETVSVPFMDIVRANGTETVALTDAEENPLVQAGSILFVANMPGEGNLAGVTLPARFGCYTLAIGADAGFLGDASTPLTGWTVGDLNKIIDTGAVVLKALDEDPEEVPVALTLNSDVDLGDEPFEFSYGNLTIDGNGKTVSGTVVYTDDAGVISNVVMGTESAPFVLDISQMSDMMEFGPNITMSNVTIVVSAESATLGTPILVLDVGSGTTVNEAGLSLVLVDAQGNPVSGSMELAWDDLGIIYIGPCEARLTGPTHEMPIYTSLVDAIALAAQSGDTVKLMSDVEVGSTPIVIDASMNLTLDIADHNISGAARSKIVANNGTLTVNGTTGCIYNRDVSMQGNSALLNNGTIVINGGWFGDSDNDKTNANPFNRGAGFRNYGTATINGGHFTACDSFTNGGFAYSIINGGGNPSILTINYADVYGRNKGAVACDTGRVTIMDGMYDVSGVNSYTTLYSYSGLITVMGGTFTKSGNDYGLFCVEIDANNARNPGSISVSGGQYSKVVDEKYCAPGYVPVLVPDPETGFYTVRRIVYVAKAFASGATTTNQYETIAEAMDYVNGRSGGDWTVQVIDGAFAEDLTIPQASGSGLKIRLVGTTNTVGELLTFFSGAITIAPDSSPTTTESVTIENILFDGTSKESGHAFIQQADANGCCRNVTVRGCEFRGDGTNFGIVGVDLRRVSQLAIEDTVATGCGSLLQMPAGAARGVTVSGCSVTGCQSGFNLNMSGEPDDCGTAGTSAIVFTNTVVDAATYGVRFNANTSGRNAVFTGCTISAEQPIVLCNVTNASSSVTVTDCTVTPANGFSWCTVTRGENGVAAVAPAAAATVQITTDLVDAPSILAGKVGNTYYWPLTNAVAAADGALREVMLVMDGNAEALTVPAATSLKLVKNGNTFAGTVAAADGATLIHTETADYYLWELPVAQLVFPVEGSTTGLPIPTQWLVDNSIAGYTGGPLTMSVTNDLVQALSGNGANGMPRWESYVLGFNPADATSVLRLAAVPKTRAVVTVYGDVTLPETLDGNTTVTFRLASRNADGTWTDMASGQSPVFDVSLDDAAGKVLCIFADIVTK